MGSLWLCTSQMAGMFPQAQTTSAAGLLCETLALALSTEVCVTAEWSCFPEWSMCFKIGKNTTYTCQPETLEACCEPSLGNLVRPCLT